MATAQMGKRWTHKVVKTQRGHDGKWFRRPAAMTGSEADCIAYAEAFAREQAGVGGTRILVLARNGAVVRDIRCDQQDK